MTTTPLTINPTILEKCTNTCLALNYVGIAFGLIATISTLAALFIGLSKQLKKTTYNPNPIQDLKHAIQAADKHPGESFEITISSSGLTTYGWIFVALCATSLFCSIMVAVFICPLNSFAISSILRSVQVLNL